MEDQDPRVISDSRSVFVRNVSYDWTPDIIEDFFKNCGTIIRITMFEQKKHSNVGNCYVEFENIQERNNALRLDRSWLLGRRLFIKEKRTNIRSFNRVGEHTEIANKKQKLSDLLNLP